MTSGGIYLPYGTIIKRKESESDEINEYYISAIGINNRKPPQLVYHLQSSTNKNDTRVLTKGFGDDIFKPYIENYTRQIEIPIEKAEFYKSNAPKIISENAATIVSEYIGVGGKSNSKKVKDNRSGKYKHKDHSHKTLKAKRDCRR